MFANAIYATEEIHLRHHRRCEYGHGIETAFVPFCMP